MECSCANLGNPIVSNHFSNNSFFLQTFLNPDTEIIEDNSFDALRRVLLMNIEKYEIPKVDDTKYTDIKISANIHHVDILDDQGSMNVHGFLKMVSGIYILTLLS